METCRACLTINKELFQVDETFLSDYNSLTNLNVKPFDGFPECFCHVCMEAVDSFIKFREQCISSESTLRDVALDIKSSHQIGEECEVEMVIKKEDDGDNFDETCQYGMTDFEIKDEVKKEACMVVFENNLTPVTGDAVNVKVVRRKKRKCIGGGRPKKKSVSNTSVSLTVHKNKPTIDRSTDEYFCGLCDESFIVLDSLNEHLECHQSDKSCGICSKEFENWPKLLTHRVFHTAKKYCHLCPRRFSSVTKMEEHYFTVHYEEKVAELSCMHCPKKFTCPQKFSTHLETHNRGCHLCTEVFANRHLLNQHLRIHEPEKRYACDMCEYTAIYANVLANHKKRRHKKFTCKICDRRFADAARLKDHVCKDKSKLCPICGQRIFDSFTRHLNSHEDAKTFKCERCPASYKNRISLKTHIDRHDNNPTHPCDYCGRKFYAKTTLIKHRRVHTGERPYACEKCGKRFTGNSNLKLHMKTHGIMLITKRNKDTEETLTTSVSATTPGPSPNVSVATTLHN